jgi:hypothetical protein
MTKASTSRSCPHKLNPQRLVRPIGSFTGGWRFTFLAPMAESELQCRLLDPGKFLMKSLCIEEFVSRLSKLNLCRAQQYQGPTLDLACGNEIHHFPPRRPPLRRSECRVIASWNAPCKETLLRRNARNALEDIQRQRAVGTRPGPAFPNHPRGRISESPPRQLFFEESCSNDDSSVYSDDSSDSSDDDDNDDAFLMAILIGTTFYNDALLMAMMFSTLNNRSRRY